MQTPAGRGSSRGTRCPSHAREAGGRRRLKRAYSRPTTNDPFVLDRTVHFVYDGWNLVAEFTLSGATLSLHRSHLWGLDLSQSLQGAGGVGGLLRTTLHDATDTDCYPVCDGNGNIVRYLTLDGTALVAAAILEYSPFGRPLQATGTAADLPYRFSTKFRDEQTGLYYYGYRYYQPEIGRWLNRDPIGERGGMNLMGFVRSDSISLIDAKGLDWEVERTSGRQALASCECDDTVADLASRIGLDPADYMKWLEADDGKPMPLSSTQKMRAARKFLIPNTVVAYWAGEVGALGRLWVRWGSSVNYLKNRGFLVDGVEHKAGTKLWLQWRLSDLANSKELHGLYFWGHGWAPYPSIGLTDGQDDILYYSNYTAGGITQPGIVLSYKMALGLVYACDSNSGKAVLSSGTAGSIWHGYSGTLYPIVPFGYHVKRHIKSGDQETK